MPLSIWYDWHDDGTDPKEPEHHFGTVENAYHAGRDPVYDPKPAYRAAKTLTTALAGFRFNKRLAVGGADDYVLLFAKGDDVRVAAWTTAREPHAVVIPASPGKFAATAHTGESLPALVGRREGTGRHADRLAAVSRAREAERTAPHGRSPREVAAGSHDPAAARQCNRRPRRKRIGRGGRLYGCAHRSRRAAAGRHDASLGVPPGSVGENAAIPAQAAGRRGVPCGPADRERTREARCPCAGHAPSARSTSSPRTRTTRCPRRTSWWPTAMPRSPRRKRCRWPRRRRHRATRRFPFLPPGRSRSRTTSTRAGSSSGCAAEGSPEEDRRPADCPGAVALRATARAISRGCGSPTRQGRPSNPTASRSSGRAGVTSSSRSMAATAATGAAPTTARSTTPSVSTRCC